ncbi:Arylsulfatase [Halioglobus japonicus]|nr:Arylsulfatase [Halioglobus japonicus]
MPSLILVILPVLLALSACATPPAHSPSQTENTAPPPNILLIVLDDLGYNDLGANGNPNTPTPNLDALAAEGILYTRHYADATCSVARAALMTGTFPASHGLRPNHLGLSVGTPTIATMLQEKGYRTQHIGKWHIVSATLDQSPSYFGFDDWYGFLHNNELSGPSEDGIRYWRPTYQDPWLRENQSPLQQESGHLTDILTERAIGFLDQQKDVTQPWFLNLWYYAPHAPIQPDQRFAKQYPDTKEGKYHALIDQLDFSIGRVMAALDKNGEADNTLVIVVSDNGGTNKETDNNYPFAGEKATLTEGGLRTPLFMRWPAHIAPNVVSDELVSILDIFPTIAQVSAATPPNDLLGRSLLDPDRGELPELYWEYSNSEAHQYSVLSSDGRWRLLSFYGMRGLTDLNADPSGKTNVIDRYPDVAAQMTDNYLQWRKEMRNVSVEYEQLNSNGGAILTGDDMQRSPGYSGFTLAIGVTPSADEDGTTEVIAEQTGRWRLQSSSTAGLQLEVLGRVLKAPALAVGQCSEVVVSSQFNISPVNSRGNKAHVDLYINGVRAANASWKNPALNTSNYTQPTYIGMNPNGEELFNGELSKPRIINERVVPDKDGKEIGNGISGVPATCPAT